MPSLLDSVADLLKEVAETELLSRFRRLGPAEVTRKWNPVDPDDLVTTADRAAEAELSRRLVSLLPGSVVVGEEAAAAEPRLLEALRGSEPIWLVDPLDGTKNFARGSGPFATMVALVQRGELLLSSIYFPVERQLWRAERGGGVERPHAAASASGSECSGLSSKRRRPRGSIHHATWPGSKSPQDRTELFELRPPFSCTAFQYAELGQGIADFALYYRLAPWDHAPGALILRETGGVVRHLEGREYRVTDDQAFTLLAADEGRWKEVSESFR